MGSVAYEILITLLVTIDVSRRSLAKNITPFTPYFGYVEADRKTQWHDSITNSLGIEKQSMRMNVELRRAKEFAYWPLTLIIQIN